MIRHVPKRKKEKTPQNNLLKPRYILYYMNIFYKNVEVESCEILSKKPEAEVLKGI